jgi:predicted RNase H-like nuclease (RuvC/YqgF family)
MNSNELLTRVREVSAEHGARTAAGLIACLHDRLMSAERQVQQLQESNTAYVNENRRLRQDYDELHAAALALRREVSEIRDSMVGAR